MASTLLQALIIPLCLIMLPLAHATKQQQHHLSLHHLDLTDEMPMMSIYDDDVDAIDGGDDDNDEGLTVSGRRSVLWRRMRYYISYGALSANRVPCPPRSGRSYYTRNCWRATGPVHPYYRGCSTIARCRR
ncbi:hypothetical protein SSX86_029876 [Deinandra increscens subsp. villosa]|uniref:Rapid ALkalinization Factor n=1 Tax=Deinandra increscens subsp. villosa TaxID=3103831 RepID=A0AAP0CHD2_9ASTR